MCNQIKYCTVYSVQCTLMSYIANNIFIVLYILQVNCMSFLLGRGEDLF